MHGRTIISRSSAETSRRAGYVSLGLVVGFLVILGALHLLEPELDPSWRWISEYELGHFGWMMSLALFLWGGSPLSLAVAVWSSLRTLGGRIGAASAVLGDPVDLGRRVRFLWDDNCFDRCAPPDCAWSAGPGRLAEPMHGRAVWHMAHDGFLVRSRNDQVRRSGECGPFCHRPH
jgi:hypothetical protein